MKLPFMPETWSMFLPVLAGGWLLLLAGAHWGIWFLIFLGVVVLVIAALILNFFRDFERSPEKGLKANQVLSPADGKVVIVKKATEKFYLKKPALHIAIFMNPLNNHVQRAPFDGKVLKKIYHEGEFMAAYEDKADLVNEQAHLVVELKGKGKAKGKMVIKQIAGFLCRRVVTTAKAGDSIQRGKRIGRILLGSRVDVFMPVSFKSNVKVGDQVKAGVTVLGEF